ncbi:MAG TPA: peptidylprolyl isomerase [Steroidobacteraceae bacterium]|nr:peptidylprolyl isomerase [Steroidobacteraceae bacterium]
MSDGSTGTRSWLREPLLHFLLLGAGLFLLFRLVGGDSQAPKEIVVTEARVEALAENFARTWMRPPTAQELAGLVDDYVKEEIFYREAVTMGLDRDDIVIRRRLRQKLEFISEDVAVATEPTDQQLQEYLDEHPEKFVEPDRQSFQQVYFSPDRRGEAAMRDAEKLLSELLAGRVTADPAELGDPTLLPQGLEAATPQQIASTFGEDFALQVAEAPVGQWTGPVRSSFGWHVLRVTERMPGTAPTLETIRPIVAREWQSEQRQRVGDQFYQAMRSQYDVRVEGELGELLEKFKATELKAAQ